MKLMIEFLAGCQAWLSRLENEAKMDNLKKLYDKYSVYITRPRLEIATIVVIALCAIFVFVGNMPKQGDFKIGWRFTSNMTEVLFVGR